MAIAPQGRFYNWDSKVTGRDLPTPENTTELIASRRFRTFANYDRVQPGQMVPYGLTMNTQLVQFNPDWTVDRAWIFPSALWESFSPMSNSGGSFGPDGWLYITGHDASEVYVLKLPSAGDVLV